MVSIWSLSILILSCSVTSQAQGISEASIEVKSGNLLKVDKLGQAYLKVGEHLHRYSDRLQLDYTFEAFSYGELEQVDVTNPMKLVLYYPDLMNVVILDNTLSELNVINLLSLGYQQVTAAARARDNHIWIYDYIDFQLKKIDESGNVLASSENLNVLLNESIRGTFIIERNNKVYLSDPDYGILVFDAYATFARTIPVKQAENFQVLGEENIGIWQDSSYIVYDKLLNAEDYFSSNDDLPVIDVKVFDQYLYILLQDKLIKKQ
jgi:hypothetical protein